MTEGLVAKRYAEALFEVAKEKNLLDTIERDLLFTVQVIEGTDGFMTFLRHPQIDEKTKKDLINKSFQESISETTKNFLYQLIDSKRIEYIEEIAKQYIGKANEARNIVEVETTTSSDLSDEDISKVRNILSTKLGKEVRLSNAVDSSILGGMIIKIGDRVYDGSINKQLKVLKRSLSASRV